MANERAPGSATKRAVLLLALASLLASSGCGPDKPYLPPPASGSATVLLSDHWTLAREGAAMKFYGEELGRHFLITHVGGQYHALDSWCTHKECGIEPKARGEGLVCPCHSAAFSLTGEIQDPEGPVVVPMIRYALERRGDTLIVDFSDRSIDLPEGMEMPEWR